VNEVTELFSRLFVKDYKNVKNSEVRTRYGTMVSIVGICVNVLLSAFKLVVGVMFGSLAISADAVNNLSDALSSVLSFVSFKMSSKPADRDHPFGHARIEYVASMIVSFLVLLIGFNLARESIEKMLSPSSHTSFSILSVAVLIFSILMKLWLYFFNSKIGKKIDSEVMRATATDCLADIASGSAVLVSVIVLRLFSVDIDAFVGILVSLFIMFSGGKILNDTKNFILGTAPEKETIDGILAIVGQYPEALGVHDMLVHSYGAGNIIASFHVEVDGNANIMKSHDVIDNMEKRIKTELGILCTIHLDPLTTDDETVNALRTEVIEKIKEISHELSIHDFRVVTGETHTNIIFDVAAPFELKMSDSEIKEAIQEKIQEKSETYFTVIEVDRF
jgi:cation diffusion facilitator family transporter